MTRSPGPRKTANLSNSLHQRLNIYALAAGATGVGVSALVQPASAKIVYTPANVTIQGSVPLDLDHNGVIDFYLWHSDTNNGSTVASFLAIYPNPAGCAAIGTALGNFRNAVAIEKGARIAHDWKFINPDIGAMAVHSKVPHGSYSTTNWKGRWADEGKGLQNRYLGLKFKIRGQTHFGWARVTVTTSPGKFSFTAKLTGYAYETIPNKAILAGRTKGPEDESRLEEPNPSAPTVPTSEPATLGALAVGAPGLSIWGRESQHFPHCNLPCSGSAASFPDF